MIVAHPIRRGHDVMKREPQVVIVIVIVIAIAATVPNLTRYTVLR
ncbi:hypothetical protein [Burkholderia cepacia]|nr:hypothetical protein [Burkholderia cepacia]